MAGRGGLPGSGTTTRTPPPVCVNPHAADPLVLKSAACKNQRRVNPATELGRLAQVVVGGALMTAAVGSAGPAHAGAWAPRRHLLRLEPLPFVYTVRRSESSVWRSKQGWSRYWTHQPRGLACYCSIEHLSSRHDHRRPFVRRKSQSRSRLRQSVSRACGALRPSSNGRKTSWRHGTGLAVHCCDVGR